MISLGGGKMLKSGSYKMSTDQIKAHGEVTTKIGVLIFIGIICGLLTIGGLLSFFIMPDKAKDVWVIIGPIISGGVSGSMASLATQKENKG